MHSLDILKAVVWILQAKGILRVCQHCFRHAVRYAFAAWNLTLMIILCSNPARSGELCVGQQRVRHAVRVSQARWLAGPVSCLGCCGGCWLCGGNPSGSISIKGLRLHYILTLEP